MPTTDYLRYRVHCSPPKVKMYPRRRPPDPLPLQCRKASPSHTPTAPHVAQGRCERRSSLMERLLLRRHHSSQIPLDEHRRLRRGHDVLDDRQPAHPEPQGVGSSRHRDGDRPFELLGHPHPCAIHQDFRLPWRHLDLERCSQRRTARHNSGIRRHPEARRRCPARHRLRT